MDPKLAPKFSWSGKKHEFDPKDITKYPKDFTLEQIADAIKYISNNYFSYNDQALDIIAMVGAVPPRYEWPGEEIGLEYYISVAHGNATLPAMTKWFDTNSHYIVPELIPEIKLTSHKAVDEFEEAKELGIHTAPVIVGPVSYLLLSKPAKGIRKTFNLLSLIDSILPIYKDVLGELKGAGTTLVQLDEPGLEAFTKAYSYLEAPDAKLLVETYFADIPAETYKTIIWIEGHLSYWILVL